MERMSAVLHLSSSVNDVHVFCDLLNNTAASDESAQPASESNTQQNEAPSETANVPCIPESNSGTSRLQPEQVPHQQSVAESQAPPPVRVVFSIMLLVYLWQYNGQMIKTSQFKTVKNHRSEAAICHFVGTPM